VAAVGDRAHPAAGDRIARRLLTHVGARADGRCAENAASRLTAPGGACVTAAGLGARLRGVGAGIVHARAVGGTRIPVVAIRVDRAAVRIELVIADVIHAVID